MSGSVCLSLVFLSHEPRHHDLAMVYITMMHRSAVAPCALCHEIGACSAACTTAKSVTKKCLMIGEDIEWLPSRFMLYPLPCLCGLCAPPFGKIRQFCRDAVRIRRSPVSELPYCGLQAFPVSVALLYRVWVHHDGVGSFSHSFNHVAENDSQAMAPGAFLRFHPTTVFWQVSWTGAFLLPFLVLPASSTVDVLLALLLFLQLH